MITPNDALQFIKDHHNGEIPYMFGKNEYARWMAEFANHIVTKHLHKLGVMRPDPNCPNCKGSGGVQTGFEEYSTCPCVQGAGLRCTGA